LNFYINPINSRLLSSYSLHYHTNTILPTAYNNKSPMKVTYQPKAK